MRGQLPLPRGHGVPRVLGRPQLRHHQLRQLHPVHAHRLPVHHPRGVDRDSLLGMKFDLGNIFIFILCFFIYLFFDR